MRLVLCPPKREINVKCCIDTLTTIYPRVIESIGTKSGRTEVAAAICICIEQTFTQGATCKEAFGAAFSKALSVYIESTQQLVNKAIAELPRLHDMKKLIEIIKTHRLRILI
ncbi:hypothetical protein MVEN_02534400 [Mycena venus]|uniref:Uncharacterized protein n=1 Tax=Mycena venus TaxID=2733690 RepID=A0A8H6TZQ7_9AGAR|nr:hypothetical protein MVEN_02534400 [Mycena venus]